MADTPAAETALLHALEQARQDLRTAERAQAARTELLLRLSHELRTPLNALIGFAQLLETDAEGATLNDGQRRRLAQIRQAAAHLHRLVGDLQDLSLGESGQLTVHAVPVPLAPLAAECLALVHGQAESAEVRLLPWQGPEALTVRADPTRLQQVLINLLTNSIKYNRRGGQVRLGARVEAGGLGVIEVDDTGIGIPADQIQRVFQPFDRLGREGGQVPGTGLGLAIASDLVTRMGGELRVQASTAAGTCMQVRLPTA